MRRENFGKASSQRLNQGNDLKCKFANSSFLMLGTSSAPAQEPPRGRTMNPPAEERKGPSNRGRDSSEDTSLTREKSRSQQLQSYNVTDGEFTSFPEIMATSAQQLIARGIKSLFPI